MKTKTRREPLIDNEGSCIYCRGTHVQYTCGPSMFTEKCLNPRCGKTYNVEVAYEVHKKITTIEGFRNWLNKI